MTTHSMHRVHPYYQAILDAYAESGRPSYHQVTPEAARDMLRTSLAAAPPATDVPQVASVGDETVPGRAGGIPIRRYRPRGNIEGVCLYFHAGGWVIGDLDTGDALCRRLAAGAGCEVVSVDYRLAPENPYPAALNDAIDVLNWAGAATDEPLVVAGESAGGNLAAAAAIWAHRSQTPALAGQFLAYPVTDHDFSTASYREVGGLDYLLSAADMRWFWDHYCPADVNRDDPLVSPLRLDSAAGLAPALIFVAEFDPLRDEGLAYAQRLCDDGVAVQRRCDQGMLHGYLSAAGSVPVAAEAVAQAAQWIKRQIATAAGRPGPQRVS